MVYISPEYAEAIKTTVFFRAYVVSSENRPVFHFSCRNLEVQQPFVCATAYPIHRNRPRATTLEIQIPHAAILYILGFPKDKNLGFETFEERFDKDGQVRRVQSKA
jgi:hypothetical protein